MGLRVLLKPSHRFTPGYITGLSYNTVQKKGEVNLRIEIKNKCTTILLVSMNQDQNMNCLKFFLNSLTIEMLSIIRLLF